MRDLRSSHDHYYTLNNYKAEKFLQIHFDDEEKNHNIMIFFWKWTQKVGGGRVLWKRYLHDFEILSIPFEWRNFHFLLGSIYREMGSRIFSRAPILTSSIIINGDGPVWGIVLLFLNNLSFWVKFFFLLNIDIFYPLAARNPTSLQFRGCNP